SRRTEFSRFLKKIVMRIKEKRQPFSKNIYVQSLFNCSFYICLTIRERKCKFLHCRRACLTNVISGNRNRIPLWNFLTAEFENVSNYPHRLSRWIDVCTTRSILFQKDRKSTRLNSSHSQIS